MVPLLAAASAVDAASKVADTASAVWKRLSGPGQASGHKSAAGSFDQMVAAQGVGAGSAASLMPSIQAQGSAETGGAPAGGKGKGGHHAVSRLA